MRYECPKKAGTFRKWIFEGYWQVTKWGERAWGFRLFGLVIDNEAKGGDV